MRKVALKYAITAGIVLVVLFHLTWAFGSNPYIDISQLLFDILVFFVFIFFAQREFKVYRNQGFLHFWQGISIGFWVFLPSVLLFSFFTYISHVINPEYLVTYKTDALEYLTLHADKYKETFGEEGYFQQEENIRNLSTVQLVTQGIGKKLLAGFFVTPVASIILRKKPLN